MRSCSRGILIHGSRTRTWTDGNSAQMSRSVMHRPSRALAPTAPASRRGPWTVRQGTPTRPRSTTTRVTARLRDPPLARPPRPPPRATPRLGMLWAGAWVVWRRPCWDMLFSSRSEVVIAYEVHTETERKYDPVQPVGNICPRSDTLYHACLSRRNHDHHE